jgi:hypothetical protein
MCIYIYYIYIPLSLSLSLSLSLNLSLSIYIMERCPGKGLEGILEPEQDGEGLRTEHEHTVWEQE